MVSPASKLSAWLLRTCWASLWVLLTMLTLTLSSDPTGMPGILNDAKLGFFCISNDTFGVTLVIL